MIDCKNLDQRMCDIDKKLSNTQTYREFIRQVEFKMNMCAEPIDNYSNEELRDYIIELSGYIQLY